tara:strand:- start:21 stop:524 length:504 start_codon:yes stop_codon:yes gene_type:complete
MTKTYSTDYRYERTEETILQPIKTRFEVNVRIQNADYLWVKNGYMEHRFKFYPLTSNDNYILEHEIASAIKTVKEQKPDWSKKIPTSQCKSRRGLYYCSQLFSPKTNKVFERVEDAINEYASLTLHLREDPVGDIYLQCEFCDFIDLDLIFDEPVIGVEDPNGDYEF